MTSSDKQRRGAAGATSASSHTIRSAASSRSSSSVIAPPPRAQLNSSSASISSAADTDDAGSIREQREGSIKEKEGSSSSKEKDSTAALLREKDDKIAELKRGLVEIEAEFARQVERLSQNESETAAFWQAKHSALNQQFLRTDTELRLLRAELDVREAEREELKEGWELLKREINARDDEIRRLRTDLMGLKKWLSTSTRTEEQESDDLFAGDMARLGNGLQEWAIQHFRRAKIGKSYSEFGQSVQLDEGQRAGKEEMAIFGVWNADFSYRYIKSERICPRRACSTRADIRRFIQDFKNSATTVHHIHYISRDDFWRIFCRLIQR